MIASAPWNVAVTTKSPTGCHAFITSDATAGPIASPTPSVSSMPPATLAKSPSLAKSFACATAIA